MPVTEYKTPGVYVEEISTLPPSVAEVSTAVPAFFGYTEKGPPRILRVTSLLDFTAAFGGANPTAFTASIATDSTGLTTVTVVPSPTLTPTPAPTLTSTPAPTLTSTPAPTLTSTPAPTLTPTPAPTLTPTPAPTLTPTPAPTLTPTPAPTLTPSPDRLLYYAIRHYFGNGGGPCYILSLGDYKQPVAKEDFVTALKLLALEDEPTLVVLTDAVLLQNSDYFEVAQAALIQCATLQDRFTILDVPSLPGVDDAIAVFRNGIGMNNLSYGAAYYPYLQTSLNFAFEETRIQVNITEAPPTTSTRTLNQLKLTDTAQYNQIKDAMTRQRVTLPPSAAIAGIYAQVDRDRGVWKAPANVSVAAVIRSDKKMTDADQEGLNVDPTAGKSINAIRDFIGKGTLVWGARTLAGNDNEWRYVPVRRLFITIEENTRKASAFAVFEPNDVTTWLKVRGVIESYLYTLWQRAALAGSTPDAAYYVNVGLGKTMTAQDVLEGRLIVEIGIAAVRPAEFIVLRFMHKLQQA